MLAIRMQRTGRKGHAQFRVIVQDAHRHPSSGNVVALLGSYNPHTKTAQLKKEEASFYLEHGAQPSERVARLLKSEGVKLPKWVKIAPKKESATRNPEKLRKNRPAGTEAPKSEVKADEAKPKEAPATDAQTEEVSTQPPEAAEKTEAETTEPAASPKDTPEANEKPEAEEATAELESEADNTE